MPSYRHIWILGERDAPPPFGEVVAIKGLLLAAGVTFIGSGTPIGASEGTSQLWMIPCKTHAFQVRYHLGEIEVMADLPTVGGTQLEIQIIRILGIKNERVSRSITAKGY